MDSTLYRFKNSIPITIGLIVLTLIIQFLSFVYAIYQIPNIAMVGTAFIYKTALKGALSYPIIAYAFLWLININEGAENRNIVLTNVSLYYIILSILRVICNALFVSTAVNIIMDVYIVIGLVGLGLLNWHFTTSSKQAKILMSVFVGILGLIVFVAPLIG